MIKDVQIKITGTQELDGERDTTELTATGKFGEKDGTVFLSYSENGMKTQLYIKSDGSAVLKRTGAIESRFVIEPGKRSECRYRTDAGELLLGITGELAALELTPNGGRIELNYSLDQDRHFISRNTVNIIVKERGY